MNQILYCEYFNIYCVDDYTGHTVAEGLGTYVIAEASSAVSYRNETR